MEFREVMSFCACGLKSISKLTSPHDSCESVCGALSVEKPNTHINIQL